MKHWMRDLIGYERMREAEDREELEREGRLFFCPPTPTGVQQSMKEKNEHNTAASMP